MRPTAIHADCEGNIGSKADFDPLNGIQDQEAQFFVKNVE
jgi:hypothetical protein